MKPNELEIKKAKEIVNNLIEHNFFEAIICEDSGNLYDWLRDWRDFFEEESIRFHCGETKVCIVSASLPNWVIKTGFVCTNEDGENSMDYCALEADNFRDAEEEGLEECFAASYELCTLTPPKKYLFNGDVTFFIQERAEPDEEKTSSTCSDYVSKNYDGCDECDEYCEYDDGDRILSLFEGYKKLTELMDFINDWKINDLHSGNFGYTKDGIVKIIDYSGY